MPLVVFHNIIIICHLSPNIYIIALFQLRAEFEARGEEERKKIEKEFTDRGDVARERGFLLSTSLSSFPNTRLILSAGEEQCTDMINMACESVQPDTESEEFCDEFFFFTGDLDEEERKRRKRLGLYVRRN